MDKDIKYALIGAVAFLLAVIAYRYFTSEAEDAPAAAPAPAPSGQAPAAGECVEWHKKEGGGFDCVRYA